MKQKFLRLFFVLSLFLTMVAGAVAFRFNQLSEKRYSPPHFTISEDVKTADLALGERLYRVRSACIECHGESLDGVKIMENGAMGSIYGANISPFKLHRWTDEEIATAIRYGIHKDGYSLKFMPSFDFAHLSKSDVASLIKYLRSRLPVSHESHINTFGPMAKVLAVLGQMPVMFPARQINLTLGFGVKPPEGPTQEFGSYLAKDCSGCHGEDYKGGKIPGGDPSWPPAANIRLGADAFWTEAKFREVIRTGVSPKSGKRVQSPMPVEVLKRLDETEIKALWLYLSSLN